MKHDHVDKNCNGLSQADLPSRRGRRRSSVPTEKSHPLSIYFRFQGSLDRNRFRRAVATLAERHPELATRLVRFDDCYRSEPASTPQAEFIAPDPSGNCAWVATTESPFDLWKGPLFRAGVVNPDGPEGTLWLSADQRVADGVSLNILAARLAAMYNADGMVAVDDADASRQLFGNELWTPETIESDRRFWSSWEGRRGAVLTLPHAPGRTPSKSSGSKGIDYTYPPELVERVSVASHSIGAGTFSAFAFATSLVLGRWGGRRSGMLGFRSSSRQDIDAPDERVGTATTALLCTANLDPDGTIADGVASVHASMCDAIGHQRLPYDEILAVTGLRPQVALSWCATASTPEIVGVSAIEPVFPTRWPSDCDAELTFTRTDRGVALQMLFDEQQYDATRMHAVAEQIAHVLQQLVEMPERSIRDVTIAGLALIDARHAAAASECIHARFEHHVATTPEAVAVESDKRSWTYDELDRAAEKIAADLEALGVGIGERVAILASRVPSLISGCLGVAKLGTSFCIIDANYPALRIRRMLEVLEPKAVIACGQFLIESDVQQLIRSIGPLIALPADIEVPHDTLRPASREVDPNGVAYLLFTSGTTGIPKCVAVGHPPLVNFLAWQRERYAFACQDRIGVLGGLSHDPLLRDIFAPLSVGGTALVPPAEVLIDPEKLSGFLHGKRITRIHSTPQLGEVIVSGAESSGTKLSDLRTVFWGGDRLRSSAVTKFQAIATGAQQVNFYGTSETPQAALAHTVSGAEDGADVPLGRPVDGWQVDIVRDDGSPGSIGELGEIRLSSRFLAIGYIDGAAEGGFAEVDGQRVYRTGDHGRLNEAGVIEFCGRVDDQIKVRGFRVSLGEVGANVSSMPGVDHAIARAVEGPAGPQIAVYVRPTSSKVRLDAATLHGFASSTMPAYMTPAFYVVVREWPLTPNGKVDHSSLRPPLDSDRPGGREDRAEPASDLERTLAQAWADVIGVRSVGVNESFSSLGGDSITAIRLIGHLGRMGIDRHAVQGLLQGRTIRELARDIAQTEAGDDRSPAPLFAGAGVYPGTINVIRAVLVALLVLGHWLPGLLERLPERYASVQAMLMPLFNVATPGFAFVFGVTIGFSMLPRFRSSPSSVVRAAGFGALLVGGSLAALAGVAVGQRLFNGEPIGAVHVAKSFYNVLAYYFLALLTLPLWLWVISRSRRPVVAAVALAVVAYIAYIVAGALPIQNRIDSLLEWPRLMALAKFNYFSMSSGVLLGVACGIGLGSTAMSNSSMRWYGYVGIVVAACGVALSFAIPTSESWTASTRSLTAWKWLVYGGIVVASFPCVGAMIQWCGRSAKPARVGVALIASFGQCALPVFVFHHLVLDAKNLGDALGWPDVPMLMLALGMFCIGCSVMVWQVFRLFYSKLV